MESDAVTLLQAIRQGTLATFPEGKITAAALTRRNASGNTPLHAAAKHGLLRQLPPALLTRDHLTLRNDAGYTPSTMPRSAGILTRCRRPCWSRRTSA